ncbi:hypothetical protein [Scytonema sp. NUACC26]|uniref:hypothetical protein n=1 Tax=Scytonema sp. NUACC26 TaxID=3140176 RepID=UPI0034DBE6A8
MEKAIPTENIEEIEIYSVVNRVEGISPGLYYQNHRIKEGDFSDKVGYLCVNQALAKDSAVTLFLVSNYRNYQTAMQIAGFLGQRVYLFSNYWEGGCSGIGAFYDDETSDFLETKKDILYTLVIGQ